MNFLSPDDIFSGVRRKSLCNGSLLTLSNKGNGSTGGLGVSENVVNTPNKSKKERRRGSFNEATTAKANNNTSAHGGRRASLVSRWFKHITDAAEQYKRSKHATTETVDDPAIVTIPHSNTKESLELNVDRTVPLPATATVTITPLAPMIPPPTITAVATTFITPNNTNSQENLSGGVQMRNQNRRESMPAQQLASSVELSRQPSQLGAKSRHSQQETNNSLSPVVNRTMSTRSYDESPTNATGVTLRHTQSARQASAQENETGSSKRDSNSIIYAHNPNNTRTLLQTAPPLIDPSAVQISITPVHICETPAERLRRLDGNIRDGLQEKQRIICDMFRLPVEHFHEIVDIAAMPEAPKDSADIALAAYAQVQSLTELLNEYLQITPAQESAAIGTASTGCAQCHDKQTPPTRSQTNTEPPPLPPPNKQQPSAQAPTPSMPKLLTPIGLEEAAQIHEDDDGYCEIDELRLPALPATLSGAVKAKEDIPPPLPPPAGTFKVPPPPPPPPPPPASKLVSTTTSATATPTPTAPVNATTTTSNAELTKRQSTISADSIPEESAEEITRALAEENVEKMEADKLNKTTEEIKNKQDENVGKQDEDNKDSDVKDATMEMKTKATPAKIDVDTQTTLSLCPNNVVNTNTTTIITIGTNNNNSTAATATYENCNHNSTLNGPIRIQHANNMEPTVPCHALSNIVSALNTHISLLLPTINERDMERERLRKENQRLRDLLNAMQQERTRVEAKLETPINITSSSVAASINSEETIDECDAAIDKNTITNGHTGTVTITTPTNDNDATTANATTTTKNITQDNDLPTTITKVEDITTTTTSTTSSTPTPTPTPPTTTTTNAESVETN